MATIVYQPSQSNPDDDDHLPAATLALPAPAASSRRLPAPCWSAGETVALIDGYKDKWYALRRGNLRANHWQEVADDVASRCPDEPPKTAVQCRHKMEKLRKRYRTERQRATAAHGGLRRFSSSWVHFQKMHAMEKGPDPTPPSSSDEEEDDHSNSVRRIHDLYGHNQKNVSAAHWPESNGASTGFRFKIPGLALATPGPQMPKFISKFDVETENPNHRINNFASGVNGAASSKVLRDGFGGINEMGKKDREFYLGNAVNSGFEELAAAIRSLAEGFARTEMAKMEILKQVDEMRMQLETKRTEMILQSQRMILKALTDTRPKRSARRSPTPPPG